MYEHFYKVMTALDFKNRIVLENEQEESKKKKKQKSAKKNKPADEEDALSLAENLNEKPLNESGLFSDKEKAET